MALTAVRSWFGKPPRFLIQGQEGGEALQSVQPVAPPPGGAARLPAWSKERIATTDALWGEGYQFPGGEIEALRLAKPLGLSPASSLLLVGAGGGGPACALAAQLGVWVSGFEVDPDLVSAAAEHIARKNLAKRAQVAAWTPDAPAFRAHFYHHCLALEPLRGSRPEPALSAIAAALKPSGQLMMIELVADRPLDPADPTVQVWARLERRDPANLPTEVAITRILRRLGFDVRIAEDVSERHMHHALSGWRASVRTMEHARPTPREAMSYVREAELWLLRLRLFQMGRLRLVRWHAIGGGGARPS